MKKYLLLVVGLLVAFSLGRFSSPKEVQIKEVEKIVYKERSETKRDVKKNVKKKETILKDGTRIIETDTNTDSTTKKNTDKSLDSEKSKQSTTKVRPDWLLVGMYRPDIQTYGLGIQKRIISELYFGAYGFQDKTYGLSISIGF